MRRALAAATLLLAAHRALADGPAPPAADPHLWLEEVHGARAKAWVERENARTLGALQADPRYAPFHREALAIATATDRIPLPRRIGRHVYDFWQDATHVRGVWRRTTPEDYARARPAWETVLDLDALAAAEGAPWVWKGARCAPPYARCLIGLSEGGEDATVEREFDLEAKAFVPGGFRLPRSKQGVDWLDEDTLILHRDWGPGTTTTSGYGFVVKTLGRGRSLEEATERFRGTPQDVSAQAAVWRDPCGGRLVLITRALTFFEAETHVLTPTGVVRTPLPRRHAVRGLFDGRLLLTLEEPWRPRADAAPIPAGALVAVDATDLEAGRPPRVETILAPGPRQAVEQVVVTRHRVVVALYDDVQGGLHAWERGPSGWTSRPLPTASFASVAVVGASELDDVVYYTVEGFLEPTRLRRADASTGEGLVVKELPARFDASDLEVVRQEAVAGDGTRIPYFLVRRRGLPLDGTHPTLLHAYGGFQVAKTPAYGGILGKLWLERGGVYALANVRGGGEFGPAWHQAGLKTRRQVVFDDFVAVARDLVARGITSPRRLGIQGGSNGGLLAGVSLVQHPELWGAALIQVPLLDMVRFERIGAGASWVAEYGSQDVPEEAAFLRSISPYHNLVPGVAYPEPFFVTATSDDRVTPVHARKMAARMSDLGLPFLFFENTDGGHAASANPRDVARQKALEFTYLARRLTD